MDIFELKKILSLCLFLLSGCAIQSNDKPIEQKAYQIQFQNQMIGRLIHYTTQDHGLTVNKEIFELKTKFRGMDAITTRVIEIHEESEDGKINRFTKYNQTPNAEKESSGELIDQVWHWTVTRGQHSQKIKVPAPLDFMLHNQLKLRMKEQLKNNRGLTYSGWNEKTRNFEKIRLDVLKVNSNKLWKISQSYPERKPVIIKEYRVNEEFVLISSSINYRGQVLPVTLCENNCLDEDLVAIRPLDQQMLPSPYELTESALKGRIVYSLEGLGNFRVPATSQQRLRNGTNNEVEVCVTCSGYTDPTSLNKQNYLADNEWLNTDNENLVSAVKNNTHDKMSADQIMQRLVKITRDRLDNNLQFQGYASASQAFENRSGDCTEYALLLASLGRIAKIPTRVIMGIAYSRESFHGQRHKFAPHAWVEAWVDGGWKSYDAGLNQFDAGHIALKISEGDQQDFVEMVKALETVSIISAKQIIVRGHKKRQH